MQTTDDDYRFFLAHKTGDYVLALDDTPIEQLIGKKLSELLFPDD